MLQKRASARDRHARARLDPRTGAGSDSVVFGRRFGKTLAWTVNDD
jgi:hypothetical protein